MGPAPRYLGIVMLLAAGVIALLGYAAMRRDAEMLDKNGRSATLWWGTQTEIEMLRFELQLANMRALGTEQAVEEVRKSFDVLWSRVAMIGAGSIGARLREFDRGEGALADLSRFLRAADPVIAELRPGDAARASELLRRLEGFHQPLRLYTLSVMREDAAIAERLHDRIAWSARAIVSVSGLALFVALTSLFLILRDNQGQRALARVSQRAAEQAELASRAKSRLLTMMSHELRNPLNGVLGPLALLGQSEIGSRQRRLVEQASQSGHAMSQLVESLLDYGEIQDGRFETRSEPMRVATLAETIRERVRSSTGVGLAVTVAEGTPAMLRGDQNRLSQVYVHLAEYLLGSSDPGGIALDLSHRPGELVGTLRLGQAPELGWKLELLLELSHAASDQLASDKLGSDALQPLIARSLIAALGGGLVLKHDSAGGRAMIVTVPARELALRPMRIVLDTRSRALAAIYRAALRSPEIIIGDPAGSDAADLVLVDAARAEDEAETAGLRARYPGALLFAIGRPRTPSAFDEVVEEPNDLAGLRARIMRRMVPEDEALPRRAARGNVR